MKPKLIIDLKDHQTVYKAKLRTVTLKLNLPQINEDCDITDVLDHPDNVFEVLKAIYSGLDDDQEHLILLIINVSLELIGFKVIASGTHNSVTADNKVIFRNAVSLGAHSIILAHNHPTKSVKPSENDLLITRKIAKAGQIMDIELLDHIVFNEKEYHSIKTSNHDLFMCSFLDKL